MSGAAAVLRRIAFAAALAAATACRGGGDDERAAALALADTVTKAVYADDPAAVSAHLDPSLASTVTRQSVGALSDAMHALGEYRTLDFLTYDERKRDYTYRAEFEKGSMNVVVRLGPANTLAAYRAYSAR